MRSISLETVFGKPPKKFQKIINKFFLFKIIAVNCNTQVGGFQPKYCSQKISNRNNLQFCRYRCLNVMVAYRPPSTPFLTSETQNSRVDSNQESTGDGLVFCVNNALFSLFCYQHMQHKSCTQYLFFQIIRQNAVNDGFRYRCTLPYHPTTSTVVVHQNSGHLSDVFVCFHCSSLPLRSASSIDSSPATNQLCHRKP